MNDSVRLAEMYLLPKDHLKATVLAVPITRLSRPLSDLEKEVFASYMVGRNIASGVKDEETLALALRLDLIGSAFPGNAYEAVMYRAYTLGKDSVSLTLKVDERGNG